MVGVDEVGLGQRDHPVRDAEQLEDAQMLLALRLPSFRRRDDEEARIDRTDSREHVLDEADVAGHVHERDVRAGRQRGPREAEVDREPAPLLLLESVWVGAGQREDERGLAVVDVAGSRDDAGRRCGVDQASARSADASAASCIGSTVRRSQIVASSCTRAMIGSGIVARSAVV